ncbi:MAG: hypothetical protein IKE20_07455, partial [Eggerthellaceae bacterium]|nr:hypothetical protein [Eggerthellaceae bacterium]
MAKKKKRILRRKGTLSNQSREIRFIVAGFLVIAVVSLTFAQLGFLDISAIGEQAYAIVLLLPVALAAILLGVFWGTAMGLIAGIVLYYHSMLLPLDYYELTFVTPLTSIVMFTVGGFILGLLFAFALRNDPGPVKTVIYICIVCVIVSFAYSIGFVVNAMGAVLADLAANDAAGAQDVTLSDGQTAQIAQAVTRLGDFSVQAWVDALLMIIVCMFGHFGMRKLESLSADRGLKSVFVFWLIVVMVVVFMITSALCFVAISIGERHAAADKLRGDVDYLCLQLDEAMYQGDTLVDYLNKTGVDIMNLSDEQYDTLNRIVSIDGMLNGYDAEDDGIIVISSYESDDDLQFVVLSDHERF